MAGLTHEGEVVIATSHEGGCSRREEWKITGRKDKRGASLVEALRAGVAVDALQAGVGVEGAAQ